MTIVLTLVITLLLLLAAAVHPKVPVASLFETKRRAQAGHPEARRELLRQETAGRVDAVWRAIESLLFVFVVVMGIVTFNWGWGIIFAIAVALLYRRVAMAIFGKLAKGLAALAEPSFISLVKSVPWLFGATKLTQRPQRIDSVEELQQLIEESQGVLTAGQKRRITHGLAFDTKTVSSIMTPREAIESVKASELLGPLVLDELHKKGHSRFPVIKGDLDHVVGVLHVNDLLSLDDKQTLMAQKAMEPKVDTVHQDDSLNHALALFLRRHRHLCIVVNDEHETVGLLTLEDVVEALLGQRIIDEDGSAL